MSFNPLMARLACALADVAGPRPTVVELGNQTFTADAETLAWARGRAAGREGVDASGLEKLAGLAPLERRDKTAEYYRCLGFADYRAIDVNDVYGSLVMDLNRPLAEAYGFRDTFSLVTNNGTGEHVFDQGAVFRNAHDLAKPGGLMAHVLPFVDYVNHGFYSLHPNLFYALAEANGYRVLALGIAVRSGHGVVAAPEDALSESGDRLPHFLRDERRIDLAALLGKPKLPREGAVQRLLHDLRARLAGDTPEHRLGRAIRRLQARKHDLLCFAVLRKGEAAAFRVPIQKRYEGALGSSELRADYAHPARA